MKNVILPALLIAATTVTAQDLPQPSQKGVVEQVVGLTTIKVEYSRPSAKERAIFGELVPYDAVWRTGANKATYFETSGPIMIEGQELAAGKYSLFTVPHKDNWEVIFNKNTELWGESDRKAEEDVLTVKAMVSGADLTETFTIEFQNVIGDDATLDFRWEKTKASVKINADSKKQAIVNITEAIAKPDADYRTYASSARYLLDNKLMPKEALQYAEKSVGLDRKYWNSHTLALAQAANGMTKEAIATANMSLELSKKAEAESYVKRNNDLIAELSAKKPAGKVTPKK